MPEAALAVVHLLWSGRIGGIERQVAAVTRHASTRSAGEHRECEHRACFLDGRGPVGDALAAEGLADRLGMRAGWDVPGLWRLARVLRRRRPDVVHSHTHAIGPTLVARLVLPHAVFVYTEQSPRSLGRDRKFRLLYRILRRSVSRFVALTPGMAAAMEANGASRTRTVVIPNVFAVPRRSSAPECSGIPTLGIVARLESQKRVDLLLDVLYELRQRGVECVALVVGGGTWLPRLVEQADRLGVRQAVEFAGEQEDVVPWLDRMDVFLMTSEVEPFGIAALEAMARSVPVVAMPCPGGLCDLVSRGGLVLRERSVIAAADAVQGLLGSPDMRRDLRGRADATLADYTPERILPQLERTYRDALARRHACL